MNEGRKATAFMSKQQKRIANVRFTTEISEQQYRERKLNMEKQTGFRGKGKEQKTGVTGIWHRILMGVCCCLLLGVCLCRTVQAEPLSVDKEDGEYAIDVSMTGGSGKATVVSPTVFLVKDGKAYAKLQWSSSNYDYMIVDGEKILNENTNENGYSTFTIPVTAFDSEMSVIADTTAMGTPHEIAYALTFYADSIESKGALPQEAAKRVLVVAAIIIVGGGILNHFVAKRRNRDYTPHKKTGK